MMDTTPIPTIESTYELIEHLRQQGMQIALDDGNLRLGAPKGVLTPKVKQQLGIHKPNIILLLEQEQRLQNTTSIEVIERGLTLPLSSAQEQLWFLEQLNEGKSAYHIPLCIEIDGQIEVEILEQSLKLLAERQETIRTFFVENKGMPSAQILPDVSFSVEMLDAQQIDTNDIANSSVILDFIYRPFDLSSAPLLRAGLVNLTSNQSILVLVMHHIIADGWSLGILTEELGKIYSGLLREQPDPLPELPIQFIDYVNWQKEQEEKAGSVADIAYWKKSLNGAPPIIELPTDYIRPKKFTFEGDALNFELDITLTDSLKKLSRSHGVTLYMTMLAAVQILLHRYAQQDDVVVGSPMANRSFGEIEGIIGYFTNTLVLRAQFEPELTFKDFLTQVRQTTLNAMDHQQLPFDKLVENLKPERTVGYNPIYQVLFALQNMSIEKPDFGGHTARFLEMDSETAMLDLFYEMWVHEQTIQGRVEFSTVLFKKESIARMIGHLKSILNAITTNPDIEIDRISLTTDDERQVLLHDWNATATEPIPFTLVHKQFEARVQQHPNSIAIEFNDERISYAELNGRSNQLAHYLQSRGVVPDTVVGVFLPRSVDMVVAVLGILKAGGAYLPLDPIYPADRRAYMLENGQAPFVLTHQAMLGELTAGGTDPICLDTQWDAITQFSNENPESTVTTENLLYVIYTSGSTGKPKGVALPQRAMANLINWQLKETVLSDGARTAQFTSLSFDVSCQEIFTTFCTGGTLVMVTESLRKDMTQLAHFLNDQNVERLYLPFIALQQLAEIFDKENVMPARLTELITAGEQLQITDALRRFFKQRSDATLVNQYGPSESHVVTAYTMTGFVDDWVILPPIGKPIDNTQIYLLDKYFEPVPVGIVGELYIGGVNVAREYINRPEITAERFIPNPFSTDLKWQVGDNLLYSTGDLARYLPDGNIQYLGRADSQVKLRGYRIELGEIETVLASHPSVQESAAVVREDTPGDKRLVAYLVTVTDVSAEEMRQYIQPNLPDYMMPSTFMFLDKMPLTPSGKVARRALPEPEYSRDQSSAEYVAPQTELEEQMVELWQKILKVNPIGIHDNFFQLGGHSLMALRLFSQLEEVTGKKMPLSTLFEAPTIAELSARAGNTDWTPDWSILVPIQPKGNKPPYFYVAPYSISVLQLNDIGSHFKERPFYGIQPLGLGEAEEIHTTIEEMAAHNIKAIQSIQPHGPYYLGGHCAGAWVAYEMALQLEQQGESIAYLAIVDSPAPNYDEPGRGSLGHMVTRMTYYMNDRRLFNALGWKLKLQAEKRLLFRHGSDQSKRIQAVRDIHDEAFETYQIQTGYKGPMTILRSSDNMNIYSSDNWYKNWIALTPQEVGIIDIHSTHAMLIFNPQAEMLANHFLDGIEQAQLTAQNQV